MPEDNGLKLNMFEFASEIMDAGEAQIDWLKLLTYGPSGSGKTTLLASMPDPLLVLLTEKHGAMTIKRVNPRAKVIFIEDKVINGKKISAQKVLYDTLDTLRNEEHPFSSVALDSLTDMQQILLDDMKGGKPGASVSLQQWGKLIDRTKFLIKQLRNLNMHVGVICLSDEVQDNTNRLVYRPSLAGKKLPGNIIQYFNLCCFQRKTREAEALGGATYESVFESGPEYYTKTAPALDPIETPSVKLWVKKIAEYAEAHGEGVMPTESSPVVMADDEIEDERDRIKDRINIPRIKELFDALSTPEAKRIAGSQKYRDDAKFYEVIYKRVKQAAEKGSVQCLAIVNREEGEKEVVK